MSCAAAVLVWVLTGSVWSLLGYLLACYISVVPQATQYLKENRESRMKSTWMWAISIFAIMLAILGAPSTPEYLIVLIGLLVLNVGMTWITIRKG